MYLLSEAYYQTNIAWRKTVYGMCTHPGKKRYMDRGEVHAPFQGYCPVHEMSYGLRRHAICFILYDFFSGSLNL